MTRVLTDEHEAFIKANYLKMSSKQLGEQLGGIVPGTIKSFLHREKLYLPKEIALQFRREGMLKRYDKPRPEDEIIKSLYLEINVNQLAIKIGRSETFVKGRLKSLKLEIPAEIIEQRKKESCFKSDHTPFNKGKKQAEYMTAEAIEATKATRFKKGEANHNSLYDGAITLRHDHPDRPGSKPHYHIRISKSKWKELQHYNWEKEHGPIPKGHILACKDGNTLNCDPSNWELLTKADNAIRNAGHKHLPDSYVAYTIAGRNHKELMPDILKNPVLIETKRAVLKVKRAIREKTKLLND